MFRFLPALALAIAVALVPVAASADAPQPLPRPPPWPKTRSAPPAVPGGLVPAPPAIRVGTPSAEPSTSRTVLEVDPSVGRVTPFVVDDDTLVVVLTGNPHVYSLDGFDGRDLSVKARTVVVWLNRHKTPEFVGFMGVPAPAGGPGKKAPSQIAAFPRHASVFPEAVLGIYAEGAVDLTTGALKFRASELHIDPRSNFALLVEPRFDGSARLSDSLNDVPIEVRAARARIVAEGLAVFDEAVVATNRASDRIELKVRRLTVEEYGRAAQEEPLFLGFRGRETLHYHVENVVVRGERIPLVYWPSAGFGYTGKRAAEFPVRIRRFSLGTRSSLGKYARLGVGGTLGPEDDPWVDWTLEVGGYTKRGPTAGLDLKWARGAASPDTLRYGTATRTQFLGRLEMRYVNDGHPVDRNDFVAPSNDRWKVNLENRYEISDAWRFDNELNLFSDRGFNREYFSAEDRNDKDPETYGRFRYLNGGLGATFTAMAHARDFMTETVRQPEAALWSESVALLPKSGSIGLDLSTVARASRLVRRFDESLAANGYDAWRFDVSERVYAPFDLGDVRVSPFVGGRYIGYADRTDGGPDVSRTALEAGIRFNLQLHRDYETYGGFLRLDGLRHVIDLDLEGYGRWLDPHVASEVPFFDDIDLEQDRTEIVMQVRNRLDTRRVRGDERQNATVVDLVTRLSYWPEGVGPYGRRGPGSLRTRLDADLLQNELSVRADSLWDFGSDTLDRSSIGAIWTPDEFLSLAAGVRHVHSEVLAPWLDAYWRWSEKWGVRVRSIYDFENSRSGRVKLSLFRFSIDHEFEVGVSYRADGDDFGIFFNFDPSIGGMPVNDPFSPREDIEYLP